MTGDILGAAAPSLPGAGTVRLRVQAHPAPHAEPRHPAHRLGRPHRDSGIEAAMTGEILGVVAPDRHLAPVGSRMEQANPVPHAEAPGTRPGLPGGRARAGSVGARRA